MKKKVSIYLFIFSLYFLAFHLLIFDVVAQKGTEKEEEEAKEVNSHIQKFSEKLVVSLSLDNNRYVYDILEEKKK